MEEIGPAVLAVLLLASCDSAELGVEDAATDATAAAMDGRTGADGALDDAAPEDAALDDARAMDLGTLLDARPPDDLGPRPLDAGTRDGGDAGPSCVGSCPCTIGSPVTLALPMGASMLGGTALDATRDGWVYAAPHSGGISVWILDADGGVLHTDVVAQGSEPRVSWHPALDQTALTFTALRTPSYTELYFVRVDDHAAVVGDELVVEDSAREASGAGHVEALDDGWGVVWAISSADGPVRYRHIGADGTPRTDVVPIRDYSARTLAVDAFGGSLHVMWPTGTSARRELAEIRADGSLAFGPTELMLLADGLDLVAREGELSFVAQRIVDTNYRDLVVVGLDRERPSLTDVATVVSHRYVTDWAGPPALEPDGDGWALTWTIQRESSPPSERPSLWFARVASDGTIRSAPAEVGIATSAATLAHGAGGSFAVAYGFDSGSGAAPRFVRIACPP